MVHFTRRKDNGGSKRLTEWCPMDKTEDQTDEEIAFLVSYDRLVQSQLCKVMGMTFVQQVGLQWGLLLKMMILCKHFKIKKSKINEKQNIRIKTAKWKQRNPGSFLYV